MAAIRRYQILLPLLFSGQRLSGRFESLSRCLGAACQTTAGLFFQRRAKGSFGFSWLPCADKMNAGRNRLARSFRILNDPPYTCRAHFGRLALNRFPKLSATRFHPDDSSHTVRHWSMVQRVEVEENGAESHDFLDGEDRWWLKVGFSGAKWLLIPHSPCQPRHLKLPRNPWFFQVSFVYRSTPKSG